MTVPGGSADNRTIRVDLADRGYDIIIGNGVLAEAGACVSGLFPGAKAVIISDETVDALHGVTIRNSLDEAGIDHQTVVIAPGEPSKSFDGLQSVVDGVLAGGFERGDVLLALGGGVIGDLAGFAAGIIRRGMNFIQLPTSLLAQVDSSVGGKTGH